MNGSAACHEIEGVPGLYVDAFRGSFLRKTSDLNNGFILTHYHGDHYGSLPRDGKYQGPALIHCTPVTATLLRKVHKVPANLVVEHAYGETWSYQSNVVVNESKRGKPMVSASREEAEEVRITFYDANHCPGAAIVTIQLPDKVHLHTGDFRYDPKMKSYPVLQEAVRNRQLDLLYLDTTYGHPKHDFVPQEVAVNSIAAQVYELLSAHGQCGDPKNQVDELRKDLNKPKVLILLSCYSIGKEKVLWECAERTKQMVYVTEKKFEMLKCIRNNQPQASLFASDHILPCNQIIERCTREADATDIHVVPMGVAGELWPYFRPNYRNCVDYGEEQTQNYDKVVAFIPTGWANGSNWNKKNAISKRQLECRKSKRLMDVEIRLISYSEHSAFSELESFVEFCRPRKVIPTVFGDANDCRRLEKLFRKHVDSSRAKLQFFKGMQAATVSHTAKHTAEHSKPVTPRKRSPCMPRNEESDTKLPAKATEVAEASVDPSNCGHNNCNNSNPTAKAEPIPETRRETHRAASRDTGNEDCIDLTADSSDDEKEKETTLPAKETTLPAKDHNPEAGATKSSPLTNSKLKSPPTQTTPAKRKRGSGSGKKKQGTPPITQFFAAVKSSTKR